MMFLASWLVFCICFMVSTQLLPDFCSCFVLLPSFWPRLCPWPWSGFWFGTALPSRCWPRLHFATASYCAPCHCQVPACHMSRFSCYMSACVIGELCHPEHTDKPQFHFNFCWFSCWHLAWQSSSYILLDLPDWHLQLGVLQTTSSSTHVPPILLHPLFHGSNSVDFWSTSIVAVCEPTGSFWKKGRLGKYPFSSLTN